MVTSQHEGPGFQLLHRKVWTECEHEWCVCSYKLVGEDEKDEQILVLCVSGP